MSVIDKITDADVREALSLLFNARELLLKCLRRAYPNARPGYLEYEVGREIGQYLNRVGYNPFQEQED